MIAKFTIPILEITPSGKTVSAFMKVKTMWACWHVMWMLMTVMMAMNVNRADRVKAGTKSALQYIDAFNSNNIKVLSILHCTEKKDLLIFLKTIVPVIFMYSLFPDPKSKLFIHILPFGKCWPPVQCIHILMSCVSLHHTGYLYNVIDQSNVSKSDFTIKMLKLCRQSNLKLGPTQHFMQD